MPLTEAELWKVYANKIKNDYLQQSDFGSQNKIFIPPINSQAVLASGPIKQSQTNFGVFRASDPLLELRLTTPLSLLPMMATPRGV
jgi:hypothetical protein